MSKTVRLLYGKTGIEVRVPDSATILEAKSPPAIADPSKAVMDALAKPIGSPPLAELIRRKKPRTVAITISDITRPVPNKTFIPAILKTLNDCGVADRRIVIIIGTGMHRHTAPEEMDMLLGREVLARVEVIDHDAHDPSTLVQVSSDPPVFICRRFVQADFRILTGYIEPHFMAGFSGGRKGICPALVDLATVQRFHGYRTLADPRADGAVLEGNPCHEIALRIAKIVGVDFLFNVAVTRDHRLAGVFCGNLVEAHLAGCRKVAGWATAEFDNAKGHFDLVVTNGGGYPLDLTFYQTVKGMVSALPALCEHSTLLLVSQCAEKFGSKAYTDLMMSYGPDWKRFLADIAARPDETRLDQWEYQMQARVLARIGVNRLWFVSDGMPLEMQKLAAVNPIVCEGDCAARTQRTIDEFVAAWPKATIAVIPDGPYTMIRRAGGQRK
ncbi:MAG: nickel-dependent lactate racemase [Phycisphaerae bacterium]